MIKIFRVILLMIFLVNVVRFSWSCMAMLKLAEFDNEDTLFAVLARQREIPVILYPFINAIMILLVGNFVFGFGFQVV